MDGITLGVFDYLPEADYLRIFYSSPAELEKMRAEVQEDLLGPMNYLQLDLLSEIEPEGIDTVIFAELEYDKTRGRSNPRQAKTDRFSNTLAIVESTALIPLLDRLLEENKLEKDLGNSDTAIYFYTNESTKTTHLLCMANEFTLLVAPTNEQLRSMLKAGMGIERSYLGDDIANDLEDVIPLLRPEWQLLSVRHEYQRAVKARGNSLFSYLKIPARAGC